MNNKQWDTVIIGGGLAGLTAAVYLGQAGQQVLLLEKAAELGGRARTEEKAECLFNLGPHALYQKGAGSHILDELQVVRQGGSPTSAITFATDREEARTLSLNQLMTSRFLTWKEKWELLRLTLRLPKIDTVALDRVTFQNWLDANVTSPKVKDIMLTLCRVSSYSNQPQKASAGAMLRQMNLSTKGVTYLDGGWQTLVDQLRAQALRAGVTIRRGRAVCIEGEYPLMTVTVAEGQAKTQAQPSAQAQAQTYVHVPADAHSHINTRHVISTASPSETCALLGDAAPLSLIQLAKQLFPVRAAVLDVALQKLPNPNVTFALHVEQPYYFSVHSPAAKLSRNADHVVLHVLKYLRADEDAASASRAELESFLTRLQPGWQQHVLHQRFLPHLTVAHSLPLAEHAPPEPAVSDHPGLYLAGDWLTKKGLLADASLTSAKQAALCILKAEAQTPSGSDEHRHASPLHHV